MAAIKTLVRVQHENDRRSIKESTTMADDPNRVWPSGLTLAEAEELHERVIEGTRLFGLIAAVAHLLAYIYTPWLH
jgi:light-harvesting protein B-800-850 beta chain